LEVVDVAYFDKNPFGKIPQGWFDENQFIENLTHAQKWVLTCLSSYIWRMSFPLDDSFNSKLLAKLYDKNALLVTPMAERTIAKKTGFNRATICTAIDKFEEFGAVVKISGKKGPARYNLYIMGFERRRKSEGKLVKRVDYQFSNSPILRKGGKIPEDLIEYIRCSHITESKQVSDTKVPGYDRRLGDILFDNDSCLVNGGFSD
jgi:hypothetical protein